MDIILIELAIIGVCCFFWGCVEFMRSAPYSKNEIKQIKVQKETKEMKTKIYNLIQNLNCFFLVLAAIFTVTKSPFGSLLFIYTSIVGLIDAIKNKSWQGTIINSTFLAMNFYFTTLTILKLLS